MTEQPTLPTLEKTIFLKWETDSQRNYASLMVGLTNVLHEFEKKGKPFAELAGFRAAFYMVESLKNDTSITVDANAFRLACKHGVDVNIYNARTFSVDGVEFVSFGDKA